MRRQVYPAGGAKTGISCILHLLGEREEEYLESRKLERVETAFVLEVLGETRGLLPASAPLYGEDEESCLLSEDMAYKLFNKRM